MYVIVMIFNVFVVARYKLIDLLSAGKKNEKIKIRNIYVSILILLLSFVILQAAYRYIGISSLDFTKIEFKLSIILGIIGTLFFFYGISAVMLGILQRNPKIYLNNLNSFSIRQISSRFNTNFISMTVICLMLLVTMGTLACGLSVKDSLEKTLKDSTCFDVSLQIVNLNENGEEINVEEALNKEGYILGENEKHFVFKSYSNENVSASELLKKYADKKNDSTLDDFLNVHSIKKQINMIPISVYNELRAFKNEKTIDLNSDEILVACNYEPLMDVAEDFTKNENLINIMGKEYKIKDNDIVKEYTYNSPAATTIFSLIVPDNLVEGGNISVAEEVQKENGYYIYGMTRQMCFDMSRGLSTLVLFIAVYLGIVFLLASAAVLALQQLSSCSESVERYNSLRKIGATRSMINRSILTQVCTFFICPLALAAVHAYVGVRAVNSYMMALGSSNKLSSILVTALIIMIVYGGYLYGTYILYKNVIDNEFN